MLFLAILVALVAATESCISGTTPRDMRSIPECSLHFKDDRLSIYVAFDAQPTTAEVEEFFVAQNLENEFRELLDVVPADLEAVKFENDDLISALQGAVQYFMNSVDRFAAMRRKVFVMTDGFKVSDRIERRIQNLENQLRRAGIELVYIILQPAGAAEIAVNSGVTKVIVPSLIDRFQYNEVLYALVSGVCGDYEKELAECSPYPFISNGKAIYDAVRLTWVPEFFNQALPGLEAVEVRLLCNTGFEAESDVQRLTCAGIDQVSADWVGIDGVVGELSACVAEETIEPVRAERDCSPGSVTWVPENGQLYYLNNRQEIFFSRRNELIPAQANVELRCNSGYVVEKRTKRNEVYRFRCQNGDWIASLPNQYRPLCVRVRNLPSPARPNDTYPGSYGTGRSVQGPAPAPAQVYAPAPAPTYAAAPAPAKAYAPAPSAAAPSYGR